MRGLSLGRFALVVGIALLVLAVCMLLASCVGSTGARFGWATGPFAAGIQASRNEKVFLAAFVGLALGAGGAAYQAILRNDLADPYLLGIASGSALCAYLWRLPMIAAAMTHVWSGFNVVSQQSFSFVGALVAAGIVLGIAGARGRLEPATLILVGVIVSTTCSAIMLLIFTMVKSLPGSGYFQSVLVGELQTSLTSGQFRTAAAIILLGTLALIARTPRLNVVSLAEDEARTLGLDTARERIVTLVLASLVTAASVSVSGPIGFVGLIAPHVARRIVGADLRLALPMAAIGGAILLVVADAILRFLAGVQVVNQVIPIGVATALLGGPFFLFLLGRRRRGDDA